MKCGEEKPFCRRCTSTGRKCDGYGPPKSPKPALQKSLPASGLDAIEDPMEQRLLFFFSSTTASLLSGYFSTDFWERRVVQASYVEPSIRHAVVAIAAIHQDFNEKHLEDGKEDDSKLQAFAFRQYTKAISHLHQLMSTRTQELDMTLISCILFICIDCLLGNQ